MKTVRGIAKHAGVKRTRVLNVLDMYPGDPGMPGSDFAGVVEFTSLSGSMDVGARGSASDRCCIGDGVFGLAAGSLASSVVANAGLPPKPSSMTYAEAASIPTIFLTASSAFHSAAGSVGGSIALVHTATGGVGLAASQVASSLGMTFFATAGNARKRGLLRSSEGSATVMDSRSTRFVDDAIY